MTAGEARERAHALILGLGSTSVGDAGTVMAFALAQALAASNCEDNEIVERVRLLTKMVLLEASQLRAVINARPDLDPRRPTPTPRVLDQQKLIAACRRLVALVDAPEPGLTSWQVMCADTVDELRAVLGAGVGP